jgi:hypothetical protein
VQNNKKKSEGEPIKILQKWQKSVLHLYELDNEAVRLEAAEMSFSRSVAGFTLLDFVGMGGDKEPIAHIYIIWKKNHEAKKIF